MSFPPHLAVVARKRGTSTPTPPTLAPVLAAIASLGSTTADLTWTASNKTGSPGFGYKVYGGIAPTFSLLITTTSLSYGADYPAAAGETYSFYVIPSNDAGDGPSSNTASVVLPGMPAGPELTGPASATGNYIISWTSVLGATDYDVYQSPDDNVYAFLGNTASLSFAVTFDFPGMYHKVIPKNGTFEGMTSNIIYVSLLLPTGSTYLRPDGTSTYFRPDGTSKYIRP